MKRIPSIFLLTAAASLFFLASCGGDNDVPFTGSVVLTDFTSNSANTVYMAVIERGGSDSFAYIEDPSTAIHTQWTTFTGSGPADVVVAEFDIENPNFDASSGLNLFLLIASDDDGSGDLTAGDYVLPFYSLVLRNGETLELDLNPDELDLDVTRSDGGPYSTGDERVWLNINDLLPEVVDADNAVILRIHEAAQNNFSITPYYREIVIKDRRLLGDMMLYSFGTDTYYFLLHYDRDNNGAISSGDNVSYSDYLAVDAGYSVDLAGASSGELSLELNSFTLAP